MTGKIAKQVIYTQLQGWPPKHFCYGDVTTISNGQLYALSRIEDDKKECWPPDNEPGLKPPEISVSGFKQTFVEIVFMPFRGWYWRMTYEPA